jgi:hypothetical protein
MFILCANTKLKINYHDCSSNKFSDIKNSTNIISELLIINYNLKFQNLCSCCDLSQTWGKYQHHLVLSVAIIPIYRKYHVCIWGLGWRSG